MKIFDCRECKADKPLARMRGCVRPAKNRVWETDNCYVCWGENPKCKVCKGSGVVEVRRCPRALSRKVDGLLPFFIDWRTSNRLAWPDGGPRLSQPVGLSQAFDLLDYLVSKYEPEVMAKYGK